MVDKIWLLIVVIFMIGIQLFFQLLKIKKLKEKEEYAVEFHNKLLEYANSNNDDGLFVWLTQNASKMQSQMGDYGVVSYRPPFANYIINNYEIIINGIDEVKSEMKLGYKGNEHCEMLRSCILKYSGSLMNQRENIYKIIRNPMKLFVTSIKNIILFPVTLLYELGIIKSRLFCWFKNSYLASLISGIVALFTIISTIMTILLGWKDFSILIVNILN